MAQVVGGWPAGCLACLAGRPAVHGPRRRRRGLCLAVLHELLTPMALKAEPVLATWQSRTWGPSSSAWLHRLSGWRGGLLRQPAGLLLLLARRCCLPQPAPAQRAQRAACRRRRRRRRRGSGALRGQGVEGAAEPPLPGALRAAGRGVSLAFGRSSCQRSGAPDWWARDRQS